MDVSVIIVTRNTRALACEAVQSVLESADTLAKECVVVDNGSSDETPKILPQQFPAVAYVRSETNLGFARANNLGARQARGEFLLLLNSDARLQPDALVSAVTWMRAHSDCAVAGAQLLNPDGSRQNSIANFPTLATELLNKSLLRRLCPHRFPGKEQTYAEPVAVETVIGAFMLIRKEHWDALGGFDERYFFFFEETDFCRQTRRRGRTVFHLPAVRVWHGQGQTTRQVSVAARIEYWKSRYAYFAKNDRLASRVALRAGLMARLLLSWGGALLAVVLTFGKVTRTRDRWRLYANLLTWHLRGCPPSWGLHR